jgi:hypothetical protein
MVIALFSSLVGLSVLGLSIVRDGEFFLKLGMVALFYAGAGAALAYARFGNKPSYCWAFLVVNVMLQINK